ncbi:MAG: tRNA 2-thiouridine(34) synthase MnmA [Desulfomonilia bacterium]
MIAVALSGGTDSAAAAIRLHEGREELVGITLVFDEENPPAISIERAGLLCAHLKIRHVVMDATSQFTTVKNYFCREYLAGTTPNPCVVCNRDIKFVLLQKQADELGADRIATGHYVRKAGQGGRVWLGRAKERNSQEYFLGLLSQDAIRKSLFPLHDITRDQAWELAARAGLHILKRETSQDVCFIGAEGYIPFITSYTGFELQPGDILNRRGVVIGRHKGALSYTIGQRKGLGMGFGKKVYVLGRDMEKNTVTVGGREQWPYRGFTMEQVNLMKIPALNEPLAARMKVRYRQDAQDALLIPLTGGRTAVRYEGLFSPGQLAVAYDRKDDILCAGIIGSPLKDVPVTAG